MKLWAFILGFIHVILNKVWKGIDRYCGRSSSTLCWHITCVGFFFLKKYFKRVVSFDHSMTEIDFIKEGRANGLDRQKLCTWRLKKKALTLGLVWRDFKIHQYFENFFLQKKWFFFSKNVAFKKFITNAIWCSGNATAFGDERIIFFSFKILK